MSGSLLGLNGGQLVADGMRANPDPLGLEPIPEDTRQRFLRFRTCGGEVTLLPLVDVAAIIQLTTTELLPIPDVSPWLLGVCNWRGAMLWLLDVNRLLGKMPLWRQMPMLENTMIIVIQSDDRSVGMVVEQVDDVELIAPDIIVQPENLDSSITDPLVAGHLPGHEGIILDAERLVAHSFQTLS